MTHGHKTCEVGMRAQSGLGAFGTLCASRWRRPVACSAPVSLFSTFFVPLLLFMVPKAISIGCFGAVLAKYASLRKNNAKTTGATAIPHSWSPYYAILRSLFRLWNQTYGESEQLHAR